MRISLLVVVFTLCSLLAGGCSASVTGKPSGRTGPAAAPAAPVATASPSAALVVSRCSARVLVLRPAAAVVAMTGEHAVLYGLANRGPVSCTLDGYPSVVLYGATGARLRFRYARGGGPYVTSSKPQPVVLLPGASADILVAKYRCDLGIVRKAAAIRLSVPVAHGALFVRRRALRLSGASGLSYCQGGQHDPGQLVTVSPIEPTLQAARARYGPR